MNSQESWEAIATELKAEILDLALKVESHVSAIKEFEHQYEQISATLDEIQSGALQGDNMQNPPALVYCMSIDAWDDFSSNENVLPITDEPKKKDVDVDEPPQAEFEKLDYSDDDFVSECDSDWIGEMLQNIVQ